MECPMCKLGQTDLTKIKLSNLCLECAFRFVASRRIQQGLITIYEDNPPDVERIEKIILPKRDTQF